MLSQSAFATGVDVSDIDRAVRSQKSQSIMFRKNSEAEAELRRQDQESAARARAEAEAVAQAQSKMKREQQFFRPYNLFGSGLKIAATVNGEMVSNKDLQQRANLLALTTGIQINAKNKKMVAERALQNTIDEKIKLQEAKKQNIHVSEEEIKDAYRNFERSNGVPAGRFVGVLKQYQVSPDVFMAQIKANLAWNKLVARRMGGNIDVSTREVEDEFSRIKKDIDTPKYMVSEIVIKRKDAEHIDELVEILRNDKRFELYAMQFSQSASAPSGGKIGWVSPGQLAEPLDRAIRNLGVGHISNAIPYRSDYYIFRMDKIYNPKKDKRDMPTEEEVRTFIKNRKTDEMANKYIRDLRNRAVVERKF
jgi:parvulin-like peptidyl-prolyl isomerase